MKPGQYQSIVPTPVSLCQMDGLACLQVDHPKASALIALQGAQVLQYTPKGEQPVIWLSETAAFTPGKSVRGGIPICWPWFGDVRRNPVSVQQCLGQDELPAHGWARDQLWLIESTHSDEQGVKLVLRLPQRIQATTSWPMEVDLEVRIFIGSELRLDLTTSNNSTATIMLSQALHSYFSVSHIDQVIVHGLEACPYLDTLNEWQKKTDSTPLAIKQETDRIYLDIPQALCIEDTAWQRRIRLQSSGSKSAVVWNPWIEKAKRLSQFEGSAYQRMLCIETANVMSDCVQLLPGETHSLSVSIVTE